MPTTPYLTAALPGIGGKIKTTPEDFFVEEIPLYSPSGEGQHVYVTIEKRGLSTYAAMRRIGDALKVHSRDIGSAGLKDAHAITRQTLSINQVRIDEVANLALPGIKILHVTTHRNKLKTGHLAGNRFVIRVREVDEAALQPAEAVLTQLARLGVPNFFGAQRFGNRHNTDRLGEALVREDDAEFVGEFIGRPQPQETAPIQKFRQLVDDKNWEAALANCPPRLRDERRAVQAILNKNGDLSAAARSLNKKLKGLFVSAFQSRLFNRLLTERLPTLERLEDGDVAYIHGKGAMFVVTDAAAEQPRADQLEISASGPLYGPKTVPATGAPGRREAALLAEYQLTPADFDVAGVKIRGTRRPYRIPLKKPDIRWDDGLVVSFELPPGAYATTVMAEIMKPDTQDF